jgi:hypothetical protein
MRRYCGVGVQTIDAAMFRNMFLAGAARLQEKKEYINELNVFPVPDGDTGTNMTMTIMAAAKEVEAVSEDDFELLCKAVSGGSLRGARGNSGVIMSQLFRGFTKEIRGAKELDTEILTKAFQHAVESAYKAVMKPKEGTILTVARSGADKAAEMFLETEDLEVYLEEILRFMRETLDRTPEMLPVLKEAGVVDSGGEGLMTVLEGAFDFLTGKTSRTSIDSALSDGKKKTVNTAIGSAEQAADIKFGYCTEFVIMLEKPYGKQEETSFKAYLESIGDCVVAVSDEDIVKVHVHTNDPGLAIQKGLTFGSLTNMKIDNMREEHHEKVIKDAEKMSRQAKEEVPHKQTGFISVSAGAGLSEIFKGLGVDYVIEGGQTMNPSTEDILNAIAKVNADNIFLLPNNKNIIMAANQARDLTKDKKIYVIPSKTIPQGISAMIQYMDSVSPEENAETMTEGMDLIKSGQVTYAVRDTSIDGKEIHQGDLMGIDDHGIATVKQNVNGCVSELLEHMMDENAEFVSLYYGSDIKEEEAKELLSELSQRYPQVELEMNYGGQPIYYYLLSVE